MNLIVWLLIGVGAGAVAKMLTPQKESSSWLSSLVVGIIGSYVGGIIATFSGLKFIMGNGLMSSFIIATGGAFLVLWVYHKYLADKLNLPI